MTQSTEHVAMKIERDLMVRSLDEWVMQTGAVVLNSSWHHELQSLIEMAFDKGVEMQAASCAPAVPHGWKLVPISPTLGMLNAGWGVCGLNGRPVDSKIKESGVDYAAMLAVAPQPPET